MSLIERGALAVLALSVVVGCGGKQPEKKVAPAPAAQEAAPAAEMAAPAEAAGDMIGVPECDEYIKKYEACIDAKVPEASRAAMRQAFDQVRATWKQTAASPGGKEGLAMGCTQALAAAKQSTAAYGCEW